MEIFEFACPRFHPLITDFAINSIVIHEPRPRGPFHLFLPKVKAHFNGGPRGILGYLWLADTLRIINWWIARGEMACGRRCRFHVISASELQHDNKTKNSYPVFAEEICLLQPTRPDNTTADCSQSLLAHCLHSSSRIQKSEIQTFTKISVSHLNPTNFYLGVPKGRAKRSFLLLHIFPNPRLKPYSDRNTPFRYAPRVSPCMINWPMRCRAAGPFAPS